MYESTLIYKHICKDQTWHVTHIQGVISALQLWFKTTFNTFNKYLGKVPAASHFDTTLTA